MLENKLKSDTTQDLAVSLLIMNKVIKLSPFQIWDMSYYQQNR